jgi:hypothetical protein
MWLWLEVLTEISTEGHAAVYFDTQFTDVTAEHAVSTFRVKEINWTLFSSDQTTVRCEHGGEGTRWEDSEHLARIAKLFQSVSKKSTATEAVNVLSTDEKLLTRIKLPGSLLPCESRSDHAKPIAARYRWWLWSLQLTLAVVNAGESAASLACDQ